MAQAGQANAAIAAVPAPPHLEQHYEHAQANAAQQGQDASYYQASQQQSEAQPGDLTQQSFNDMTADQQAAYIQAWEQYYASQGQAGYVQHQDQSVHQQPQQPQDASYYMQQQQPAPPPHMPQEPQYYTGQGYDAMQQTGYPSQPPPPQYQQPPPPQHHQQQQQYYDPNYYQQYGTAPSYDKAYPPYVQQQVRQIPYVKVITLFLRNACANS